MSLLSDVIKSFLPGAKAKLQNQFDLQKPALKKAVDDALFDAEQYAMVGSAEYTNKVTAYIMGQAKKQGVPTIGLIYLSGLLDHYAQSVAGVTGQAAASKINQASGALKRAIDGARL